MGESIEYMLCRIQLRAIGRQISVHFRFCMLVVADWKRCGDRLSAAAARLSKNPAFITLEQPHLVPESALVGSPAQQMEQSPYHLVIHDGEMLSHARYADQFESWSCVVW